MAHMRTPTPALLGLPLRLFFETPRKIFVGLNRVAVGALDLKPPGIFTKSQSGSNGPPPGPPVFISSLQSGPKWVFNLFCLSEIP